MAVLGPLILPVLVLKLNPAGNAGDIEYANVPMPLVPLTGLNCVNATVRVSEYALLANVVTTTGAVIANENVLLLVCASSSVTVTV